MDGLVTPHSEQRLDAWLQSLWPDSFTVERQFNTPASESGYMVAGPAGDIVDMLLPTQLTAAFLTKAYRVVVLSGLAGTLSPAVARELVSYAAQGGALILGADDAAAAAEAFTPGVLGLALLGPAVVDATRITDTQTGWSSGPGGAVGARCVQAATGDFYIKDGGDPGKTEGWDGGLLDKCCSLDPANCYWFGSRGACEAALAMPGRCRVCGAGLVDVGCPAWPSRRNDPTLPVQVAMVANMTAQPLLMLTLANGSQVPAASINSVGAGTITVLLASEAAALGQTGFGVIDHLVQRLANETLPLRVTGPADEPNGGLQVLYSRLPDGWYVTLINNHGVIKQPSTEEKVDAAQVRTASVALDPAAGQLRAAWASDGHTAPASLPLHGQTVGVTVPAGSLVLLRLVIE